MFYIVFCLTERAYNLAQNLVRNEIREQLTIEAFYKQCYIKFGDPDKAIVACCKLKKIRQRNIPFFVFLGNFSNTALKANTDKEEKSFALKEIVN